MPRQPILPLSVQIVFEDKPLLRIREGREGDTTDYELNEGQLTMLAEQALHVHYLLRRGK